MEAGILTGLKGAWNHIGPTVGSVRVYRPAAQQTPAGSYRGGNHGLNRTVPAGAQVRTDSGTMSGNVGRQETLLRQERIRIAKGYYFARTTTAGRDATMQRNGRAGSPRQQRTVLRYAVLAAGICLTVTFASYWMIRLMKVISQVLH
ncbi:MAG: hypothetical protein HUU02_08585 [Bacteroidetes bacterium]|nr:hypothetical protein [Bacteroidota bacterium]